MEIVSAVYSDFSGDGGENKSAKRNFVVLGETGGSELSADRGRNKQPKLSVDTETKHETKEPPKGKTETSYSKMSDQELLESLDEYDDGMEISKETLQKIRDYSIQLHESDGFEIDVWPGSFFGVTTIVPVVLSKEHEPVAYAKYERIAKFAMDEYNKNHQTGFEFEQLERANVYPEMYAHYYLTFSARDGLNQNATHETFQALVVINLSSHDKELCFCRPKLNA